MRVMSSLIFQEDFNSALLFEEEYYRPSVESVSSKYLERTEHDVPRSRHNVREQFNFVSLPVHLHGQVFIVLPHSIIHLPTYCSQSTKFKVRNCVPDYILNFFYFIYM